MKRIILTAVLSLVALTGMARERKGYSPAYKYEVNIGWGYYPTYAITELKSNYHYDASGLDDIYGNYPGKTATSGLMSADFNIQYRKWFALGLQLNAITIRNTEMSALTGKPVRNFTDFAISMLPYARVTYLNREYLKMYTSVGVGVSFNHNAAPISNVVGSYNYVLARFQFVPMGIMVGKRVYGMAEAGLGTEFMGYRVGIGYRF